MHKSGMSNDETKSGGFENNHPKTTGRDICCTGAPHGKSDAVGCQYAATLTEHVMGFLERYKAAYGLG